MSDALCGPSNPLQNFQKHSQADRSLQQDRLTSRGSPAQGFRSADPNAGALDPEFEDFQRSQPTPFTAFTQPGQSSFHPPPQHFHQFQQPAFAGPSNTADWAADFQRMNISSPVPTSSHHASFDGPQAQHIRSEDGVSLPMQSHNHFGGAHTAALDYAHANGQSFFSLGLNQQYAYQNQNMAFERGYSVQNEMAGNLDEQDTNANMFDEASFERAFDAARAEIFAENDITQSASKRPETLDSGGVDIYPGLSLLRFSILRCMLEPTEQSIHEAALYISILETHDLTRLSSTQATLFFPVLDRISEVKDYTFTNRYALADRARTIKTGLQRNVDPITNPQVETLRGAYTEQANKSPINTYVSSKVRVATDAEMRADLDMQLNRLNNISPERRIFEAISQAQFTNPQTLTEEDLRILRLEADIISNQYSNNPLVESQNNYQEMLSDPANWLYSLSYHAVDLPEIVEMREQIQTDNLRKQPQPLQETQIPLQPLQHQPFPQEQPPLEQTQPIEQERPQTNNDDLSRAAGELVDKLQTNTSDKFKNSSFLALMRRVRDKEIIVEGDKMIESSQASAAEAVKPDYIPPPAARQWHMADNSNQSSAETNDVRQQAARDGQDVVDLLDGPTMMEQDPDPETLMTSPFYDNQHAELGRRGLFYE